MASNRSAYTSRTCSRGDCCGGDDCCHHDSADGDDGRLGDARSIYVKVRCELCTQAASFYCAADEAWLCWVCDARIHSANFLVARHSRSLLCPCCGALTTCSPALCASLFDIGVCQACAEAASATYEQRHCDEESKVQCSSDDDDEQQPSCLEDGTMGPLKESRKRPAVNACWIEGVGDSEEEDYCSLSPNSSSATFKRRNTTLIQPLYNNL